MARFATKEYNDKLEELIRLIQLLKLRLEAKYGPSIKKKWENRGD